jgi:hypothetical protein
MERYSSIKVLSVDSVNCYQAYTAALSALSGVTDRVSILVENQQAAIDALGEFETECAAKAVDGACAQFLSQNASPGAGLSTAFTTACAIAEPTADSSDCSDAYDALIEAIQGLSPRVSLKNAAAAPFNNFVTKCAKTSHEAGCLAIITDVSTADGPSKTILTDFEANCNPVPGTGPVNTIVTDPAIPVVTDAADSESDATNSSDTTGDSNPAGNNNAAIMGIHLSSKIYLLIGLISYIYLLI